MKQINQTTGFYRPCDLPALFGCSRTHTQRLRDSEEIPQPEFDGGNALFPIGETDKAAEARRLNLPKATRQAIVRKMAAKRNIDHSTLADEFLAIH